MSIAYHARVYAQALDDLEAARTWVGTTMPEHDFTKGNGTFTPEVSVSWSFGVCCTGYKELQREVSAMVATEMPSLLRRAVSNIEARVRKAARDLQDAEFLGARGRMCAGDVAKPEPLPPTPPTCSAEENNCEQDEGA